jgi:hypothetical protein
MAEQEGVIKFQLDFRGAPPIAEPEIEALNRWRGRLIERGLLGQDNSRYSGYGFGNISKRLPPYDAPVGHRSFLISGTQTGNVACLGPEHYAVVTAYYPERNTVVAEGPIRPSSESLTHGVIYDMESAIRSVFHVHSPEIWQRAASLGLPITREDVPYGTPEMAEEVRRLFRDSDVLERGIFSMGGHEDGIVSFGRSEDEAGEILLRYLLKVG